MVVALRTWLDANPLRRWRTAEQVSLMATCGLAGVSMSAVQKWEAGAARPTPENMITLARITGRKGIADDWTRWLNQERN